MRNFRKISLILTGLFLSASKIFALPADILLGVDVSKKSFQGHFGEQTYGDNLFAVQAAFDRPKGDPSQDHGPNKQAPMLWALRLALPTFSLYNYTLSDGLFGIGTQSTYESEKILNLVTASSLDDGDFLSYIENTVEQIGSSAEFGSDFNPIPFMKHLVNQLDKQVKPKLFVGMVFCSGDIEDSKREEIRDFLIQTSFLPIKRVFVVVGRDSDASELGKLIKSTQVKERLFDNAKVFSTDRYFDFDGLGGWTKFDIEDSLKECKRKKFEKDVNDFLHKEYEEKVLKLIHARNLIKECRTSERDLVEY